MRLNEFQIAGKMLRNVYTAPNAKRIRLIKMKKFKAAQQEKEQVEFYFEGNNFPLGVRQFLQFEVEGQEPSRIPNIEFFGELREYQKNAITSILETNPHCGMLVAPTGSGKTVVICYLIAKVFREKTLILVKNKQLMHQIHEAMLQFTTIPKDMIGFFGDGFKEKKPFTIMTQSSFIRNAGKVEGFDTIIVDECDTFMGDETRKALCLLEGTRCFGFTATPFTDVFQRIHLERFFGPITEVSYSLPVPKIFSVSYDGGYRYNPRYDHYPIFRQKIDEDEKRIAFQVDIVRAARKQGVFSHMLVLYDRLEAVEKFRTLYQDCETIIGEKSVTERMEILGRFEENGGVVAATEMTVGRGFDLPKIDCVGIFFPNKFRGRLIQMIGRALRPLQGKAQPSVIDFSDSAVAWQTVSRIKTYRHLWGKDISVLKFHLT